MDESSVYSHTEFIPVQTLAQCLSLSVSLSVCQSVSVSVCQHHCQHQTTDHCLGVECAVVGAVAEGPAVEALPIQAHRPHHVLVKWLGRRILEVWRARYAWQKTRVQPANRKKNPQRLILFLLLLLPRGTVSCVHEIYVGYMYERTLIWVLV